jgi:beta-N-acetylhexosaminidase
MNSRAGSMARWLSAMLWCALLVAIPLALTVRNPMLLRWHPVATPGVIAFAAVVVLFIGIRWFQNRHPLRGQRPLWPLWALWASVLVAACMQEGLFHWRKSQVLAANGSAARELGAHMVIGYTDPHAMKTLVARGLVGGIFITAGNVKGRSAAAIRADIDELQQLRRHAGLAPLVVSTDQEGGAVSRMSPPLQQLAPLADLSEYGCRGAPRFVFRRC